MNNFVNVISLLSANDAEMPAWVVKSFPVLKIVLACLICVCAIFIIVATLAQKRLCGEFFHAQPQQQIQFIAAYLPYFSK